MALVLFKTGLLALSPLKFIMSELKQQRRGIKCCVSAAYTSLLNYRCTFAQENTFKKLPLKIYWLHFFFIVEVEASSKYTQYRRILQWLQIVTQVFSLIKNWRQKLPKLVRKLKCPTQRTLSCCNSCNRISEQKGHQLCAIYLIVLILLLGTFTCIPSKKGLKVWTCQHEIYIVKTLAVVLMQLAIRSFFHIFDPWLHSREII